MIERQTFSERILMIGYGSVGRCVLPLLERHIDLPPARIAVIEAHESYDHDQLNDYVERGLIYEVAEILPGNMAEIVGRHVGPGDLLINVSMNVSSLALMDWCHRNGVLYIDTSIEPWPRYYDNPDIPVAHRTTYHLRHLAFEMAKSWPPGSPTVLVSHGANPGLITYLAKQALVNVADFAGIDPGKPRSRADWANLALRIGLKAIHVSEHDTQIANIAKRAGEFVNTWSVPGFWEEALQPVELGWGTHEKQLPPEASRFDVGSRCAIYLERPGCLTRVRSWTPSGGPFIGMAIAHAESVTLAELLTVKATDGPVYRPTVNFAYHPCNDALLSIMEMEMRNFSPPASSRLLTSEIVTGMDELGALLMGDFGTYWYGSQLSIDEARRLVGPQFNATSVQIAIPVVAGALWLIAHPDRGLVEPEDVDHEFVLDICRPWLGPVVGVRSDWTPLQARGRLFPEPQLDFADPWQFVNFRTA
ncbi:MAG: saccharopine dehydrogenase C-terminal domain-containing protein [Dongiaceae bacterium]